MKSVSKHHRFLPPYVGRYSIRSAFRLTSRWNKWNFVFRRVLDYMETEQSLTRHSPSTIQCTSNRKAASFLKCLFMWARTYRRPYHDCVDCLCYQTCPVRHKCFPGFRIGHVHDRNRIESRTCHYRSRCPGYSILEKMMIASS
ncbi:unnamed protein product, partial [Mycena citricolor]